MKNLYLLIFFMLYAILSCQAQAKHTVFLTTGYTFNKDIELNKEKVKNSRGYILTFGGTYKIFTYKSFYTDIGLAGKTIFASGETDSTRFNSRTLRLAVPIKFAYILSDKWEASSGFVFQNNTDFSKLDLRLRDKYSWRVDFLAEVKYSLNDLWSLTAGLNLNLRNIPDSFFHNDPKKAYLIGVARRIHWIKKKKS